MIASEVHVTLLKESAVIHHKPSQRVMPQLASFTSGKVLLQASVLQSQLDTC